MTDKLNHETLRTLATKIRAFVGMKDVTLANYLDDHADAWERLERLAKALEVWTTEADHLPWCDYDEYAPKRERRCTCGKADLLRVRRTGGSRC